MTERMRPIRSESKAQRIKWGNPQNTISWAYMKELRENNKTKKIYDINPYIEVYQFRDNLYGLFNQNCDGAGDVWMYLIVGPEKAMLIDTAYGLGDVPGLLDILTGGKPVIVANTHHHCDHAYGNCRFDKVYCHEILAPMLARQDAHMWDYLFDENGDCIWLKFDREDLPTFKEYEIVGVPDGYIFDLGGGYQIELIWTAGHAGGHAMFLDKTNRILFTGDDVCSDICGVGSGVREGDPTSIYCNIFTYRNNVRRLVARLDEIDYLFPAHFMVNLESNLLLDILDTCNAIVEDPDNCDFAVEQVNPKGGAPMKRLHKFIRGFSTIAYGEKGVFPPEGTPEVPVSD